MLTAHYRRSDAPARGRFALLAGLSACGRGTDDLRSYIDQVQGAPGRGVIEAAAAGASRTHVRVRGQATGVRRSCRTRRNGRVSDNPNAIEGTGFRTARASFSNSFPLDTLENGRPRSPTGVRRLRPRSDRPTVSCTV